MSSSSSRSGAAAPPLALQVGVKPVGFYGDFHEVAGCTHDTAVQALKDRVVNVLRHGWGVVVLSGQVRLYYAGSEEPDDDAAVLRGKRVASLVTLRDIVGDARTAFFLVEVALLGGGASAAAAAAVAAGGAGASHSLPCACRRVRQSQRVVHRRNGVGAQFASPLGL
jgi:hypothetical protein